MKDLQLSGSDISLIKCFGAGTTAVKGKDLAKAAGMVEAEFIDTLHGLIILDLVTGGRTNFKSLSDIETVSFQLNSGRLKEIRGAVRPQLKKSNDRRR